MFKTIRRIHFVGIGGSGMSGIAEVLLNLGYDVSGSDLKSTDVTERLQALGARICLGHEAQNLKCAQVVVTSTAVDSKNPEVLEARAKKIPVIARIEMLAELARLKYTIAVAGTHGKTTTTSMTALILEEAGFDPTYIIGGKVHALGGGARLGQGEFLVAEADESDGSFLKLAPTLGIITNIDNDHLDYYGSMEKLQDAFVQFANRVPFYGAVIVCADDALVGKILPRVTRRVVTYSLHSDSADVHAGNLAAGEAGNAFDVWAFGQNLGRLQLKAWGEHNVRNALAAIACALELKIELAPIARALGRFESVARRLELKGEKNGALWVDDYGHHPTEMKATIAALKQRYPQRKIVVLFQPHRFSRTQLLMDEFGPSLAEAEQVFLLPIYPAGEAPIAGVDSAVLAQKISRNLSAVSFLNGDKIKYLASQIQPGVVFLTLGAGDVWKTGEALFKH